MGLPVSQTFAGILGPLALLTSLGRGFIHGRQPDAMLWAAWISLVVFALVGYVVGFLAGRTVEESVAATLQAQLAGGEKAAANRQAASPA